MGSAELGTAGLHRKITNLPFMQYRGSPIISVNTFALTQAIKKHMSTAEPDTHPSTKMIFLNGLLTILRGYPELDRSKMCVRKHTGVR